MKINGIDSFTSVLSITRWNKINGINQSFNGGTPEEPETPVDWSTIYTYTTNATHATITNWIGAAISTSPNVPATIEDKQTVITASSTFFNKSELTNCYINESVIYTSNYMVNAFRNCVNLIGVDKVPNTVTNMTYTFYGCTNLVNAPTIGTNVTLLLSAFQSCTNLVNAPTIPGNVTNMLSTFYGCTNLINAPTIPGNVPSLYQTFRGCTSLVNAPIIGTNVTNMTYTFAGCTNLVNAPTIPGNVTNMYYTFQDCTNLITAPTIGTNVVGMARTFYGCTNLSGNITIVNVSVVSFSSCFEGCSAAIPKTLRCPAGSDSYTLAVSTCDGKNGVTVVEY